MTLGWYLFGSTDKKHWVQIDQRINQNELNVITAAKTFQADNDQFFNYFQISLIQNSRKIYNYLCINKIEFFGVLSTKLYPKNSNSHMFFNIKIIPYLFVLI